MGEFLNLQKRVGTQAPSILILPQQDAGESVDGLYHASTDRVKVFDICSGPSRQLLYGLQKSTGTLTPLELQKRETSSPKNAMSVILLGASFDAVDLVAIGDDNQETWVMTPSGQENGTMGIAHMRGDGRGTVSKSDQKHRGGISG